jgi:hypothetical protein
MSVAIADWFLTFSDKLFYIAFSCKVLQPGVKVNFKLARVSVEIAVTGACCGILARTCAFVNLVPFLRMAGKRK